VTHSRTPRVARLALTALMAVSLVSIARAGQHRFPEYTYNLPQSIADAQAVLLSEHYLKPGGYQRGTLDSQTIAAIKQFQDGHLIPSSGRLDRDTMAMLMSHLNPRSSRVGSAATNAGRPATSSGSGASGGPASPDRTMPVTGAALPFPAVIGALLMAGGLLLYRRGL